jgi:hypothetical protein
MTFFASRVRWKKSAGPESAIGKSLVQTAGRTSLNRRFPIGTVPAQRQGQARRQSQIPVIFSVKP